MARHTATVTWSRGDQPFTDNRYSRVHSWRFDGGAEVQASASPQVVPAPMSDASAIDPEEAFVAAVSACHMLWFLSIASRRGLVVDRYEDEAEGVLEKDADGRQAITTVTLRPRVTWQGGSEPDEEALSEMHHRAHESCFIARSIRSKVEVFSR